MIGLKMIHVDKKGTLATMFVRCGLVSLDEFQTKPDRIAVIQVSYI